MTLTERPRQQRRDHLPGDIDMWVMVLGDMIIFAGYFIVFMIYRSMHAREFLAAQEHLGRAARDGGERVARGDLDLVLEVGGEEDARRARTSRDGCKIHLDRMVRGVSMLSCFSTYSVKPSDLLITACAHNR